MKNRKTKVFLTGATGVMGMAGLKELMKYTDRYEVTVLARKSRKNRRKLKDFERKGVKIVWGDLLDFWSLEEGIREADVVLHVGGMVSPMAEHFPEKTMDVNVRSMKQIARIVKQFENADPERVIKIVYIGSVSQYGSHLQPNHWGAVGDKLQAAKFDAYAVSKILAERALVEAGSRKWVSLRQTGILHPGLLMKANDPVAFHVPINGVLEWISTEDSGRLLEKICRDDVPEEFWNNFYNIGGGENLRLTNLEFERGILKAMGCPPPEKVFEPNWFATRNFHGIWFEDSDYLEELLHFRSNETFEEILGKMKARLPFYFKMAPLAPPSLIKKFMKRVAKKEGLGPLSWIEKGDDSRIEASWGSRQNYDKIPDWKEFQEEIPSSRKTKGYRPLKVSDNMLRVATCPHGHSYSTSDALEAGGHGCPECLMMEAGV